MALRCAVEALGPALKENRAPDCSLTLGQIAKTQAVIGARLEAMEDHPTLRLTPAAFGAQMGRVVAEASCQVLRDAKGAVRGISGASHEAQAMLGSARTREAQNWRLLGDGPDWRRGRLGLVPTARVPARAHPALGSLPDRLATAVLGEDGWSAGAGLMQRTNSHQWSNINEALLRSEAAGDELKGCHETAKKSGNEQRCGVTVRPQIPMR